MKKRILLAMATLSLLIVFTGCGKNKGTAPTLDYFCYLQNDTDMNKALGVNFDADYLAEKLVTTIYLNKKGDIKYTYTLAVAFTDPDLDVTKFHLSNDNFKEHDWEYELVQKYEGQYSCFPDMYWTGTGSGYMTLTGYVEDAAGNTSDEYTLKVNCIDPNSPTSNLSANLCSNTDCEKTGSFRSAN